MCLWRKKVKKATKNQQFKKFKIHQFAPLNGLREAEEFTPSIVASPGTGRNVKNISNPKAIVGEGFDALEKYEVFRSVADKKMTQNEIIDKYGNAYYEFNNILSIPTDGQEQIYQASQRKPEKTNTGTTISPIFRKQKSRTSFVEVVVEDPSKQLDEVHSVTFEPETFKSSAEFQAAGVTNNPVKITKAKTQEPAYFQEQSSVQTNFREFQKPSVSANSANLDADILNSVRGFTQTTTQSLSVEPTISREVSPTASVTTVQPDTFVQSAPAKPKEGEYFVPLNLFHKSNLSLNDKPDWLLEQIKIIDNTIVELGFTGKVVNSIKGPTVTRYEIEPDSKTNVSRYNSLIHNLQMNLSVTSIRMQTPIPGKPYIGVEVPNINPEIVNYSNVIRENEFRAPENKLVVPLGIDIDGKIVNLDITKMPHGLIAGATNSGKSVCVNTIITSLILKNSPEELKLILIDPKVVELKPYEGLPHLLTKVITDPKKATAVLSWAISEMDRRFKVFWDEAKCKNIENYNARVENKTVFGDKMPYIVIVIEELAELIVQYGQEVDAKIQRLTQKARAAGIHLIVATQRPTTDVIKGTIKANIPTRIGFKVATHTDSSTIIDETGCERLLGRGDMLFKELDTVVRLQGAYISDDELFSAIDYIKTNYARQEPEISSDKLASNFGTKQTTEIGPLFKEIARFVVKEQSASINAIQRNFAVGFNAAQKYVADFVRFGICAPAEGPNKPSKVQVNSVRLEEILKNF